MQKRFRANIENGSLTLVEADVNTFKPSFPADLVLAADVLPYLDPLQFRTLWHKIYQLFLKTNGVLIGSLFRITNNLQVVNMMKEIGAWLLPDRRMVRPLLTEAKYEIIKCNFRRDSDDQESLVIQFQAKKII